MAAEGLRTVLGRTGEFNVLTYSAIGSLIERCWQDPQLDLVLVDLTGISFQDVVCVKQSLSKGRLVLWTRENNHNLTSRAISLGARGVLQKTLSPEEQLECLRKIQAGGSCFDEALFQETPGGQQVMLTALEADIMRLISQGAKNKGIASVLMISEGAVKQYLSRIFRKLGIKDRFALASLALSGFQPVIGDQRRRSRAGAKRLRLVRQQ
jgi:two-component system NarL family response regulator